MTTTGKPNAYLGHSGRVPEPAPVAPPHWSEETILRAALSKAKEARARKPRRHRLERIETLETLARMVEDKDWALPGSVRARTLTALLHCLAPVDPVPKQRPESGFPGGLVAIDELVRELGDEIRAYGQFRRFREKEGRRRWRSHPLEVRLDLQRKKLRARLQQKQARNAERARFAGGRFIRRTRPIRERPATRRPVPSACAWALSHVQ